MRDIQHLFRRLRTLTPPPHLFATVVARIHAVAHARARRLLWEAGVFGVASLGALVATGIQVVHQASATGFFQYLSLAISDSGVAAAHWQQYGLSLVETLPLTMLVFTLASLAGVMVAARATAGALERERTTIT